MYEEKEIEGFFGDSKYEFIAEQSNRSLSVEIVEFFDHVTKQKRCFCLFALPRTLKIWFEIRK